MSYGWYRNFGNPLEAERLEEIAKAKLFMNISLTSRVLSATIQFQNGYSISYNDDTPEILRILQNFLIQKIWFIPHDENPLPYDEDQLFWIQFFDFTS